MADLPLPLSRATLRQPRSQPPTTPNEAAFGHDGTVHIVDSVLLPQVAIDATDAMADGDAMADEADLDAVLADVDLLPSVLTFHVVAGERLSAFDLIAAGTAETVNGGELAFASAGDVVEVNCAAMTICQDVPTANATVHIIDSVLLPS